MPDWKSHGLRIIRNSELDSNTPQTPGMTRAEAISRARVGAQKLWAAALTSIAIAARPDHVCGALPETCAG